jgi:hypothetical protein
MECTNGKFSLFEQLWMQVSFHGIWILGGIALLQYSLYLAIGYIVLFPFLGILFFIMHLWLCPRCPHIKEHSSCIQLPTFLTKKLIKENVSRPLNLYEKVGFYIILYGIFIFPLYWIINIQIFFIPYLIFGIMHYAAYFIVFCKKCLNVSCPQNMNKKLKSL